MLRFPFGSLLAASLLTLSACTGAEDKQVETGVDTAPSAEVCDNDTDDDGDGDVDCDDADCEGDASCQALPSAETNCTDALDDDGDGLTDCDDPDCGSDATCSGLPNEETYCDDGVDEDGDGLLDCDDPDCADDAACAAAETDCTNAVDDDGDTLVDCDDADCAGDAACAAPATETVCDDELDDDGDGDIDCDDDDCDDADACRPSVELVCDDGIDQDGDGATDCDDTDCERTAACNPTESRCADGLDNDTDGLADCDDVDCAADLNCLPPGECADTDLGSAMGDSVATGTTLGAVDDYASSCSSSSAAEDVTYAWTAPAAGTYRASTDGSAFDTVLTLWSDTCLLEADCDDDGGDGTASMVEFTAAAGDIVVLVVDGYGSDSGDYVLNIAYASEIDCADGSDEDADGFTDCDDDDCAAAALCNPEGDCYDGVDEDADGFTDCDDPDCADAALCTLTCLDDDLGSSFGTVATGSTAGAGDDYTPSCDAGGSTAEDVSFLWKAPADATYVFSTSGSTFDTYLSVQAADCADTTMDCNDESSAADGTSEITMDLAAGEQVALVVDGQGAASGDYVLTISAPYAEVTCEDELDGDTDLAVDCLDADCLAFDAACDASMADADLGSSSGAPVSTGTTVGTGNDSVPSCSSSSTAEEVSFAWVAPSAGTWTFDLTGSSYDTVAYVYDMDGVELDCNDDYSGTTSLVSASLREGQMVIVVVDGYASGSGAYNLSIY